MITFSCTSCGRTLRIADEAAGKKVRCPSCATVLIAPSVSAQDHGPQDSIFPDNSSSKSSSSTGGQDSNPWSQFPQQPVEAVQSPGGFNPYSAQQANPNYASLPASNNPLGLIFGILSIMSSPLSLCCILLFPVGFIFGVIAWIVSHHERKKIEAGIVAPSGIVQAGYMLGIAGTILNLVILLLGIIYFIVMMAIGFSQNQGNF